MSKTGVIYGINGPIIHLKGDPGFTMNEMVYVGKDNLVGEVIGLKSDDTIIQVYEETTGLKPGDEVYSTGAAISVTLAPGILHNIFVLHEIIDQRYYGEDQCDPHNNIGEDL